jgi:hypothetical protein
MRAAHVVLSARNLHVWTKVRGAVPEANNFGALDGEVLTQLQRNREMSAYPGSRQYWFTVRLGF